MENFKQLVSLDLNEEQINKLIQVKNVSPILKRMHELKEKIRKIFNTALPAIMQYSFSPCPLLSKLSDLRMYLIVAGSAVKRMIGMREYLN
nr:hypothetical protein [Nostoc sphaeroides]